MSELIKKSISNLVNRGYGYKEISQKLFNNNISSSKKLGCPLSINGVKYYINKYEIEPEPFKNLLLDTVYFDYDYFSIRKNKKFKIHSTDQLIYNLRKMFSSVLQTNYFLKKEEFESNIDNYYNVLNMIEKSLEFNVQIKDYLNLYFMRQLLAIKIIYKNEEKTLLKNEIFDWMKKNDKYLIYTKNKKILLRGIINTGAINKEIVFSSEEELNNNIRSHFKYINNLSDNKETEKIQVCSEESFKRVIVRNNKEYVVTFRLHEFIKVPKMKINEQELKERIQSSEGIKPLTKLDAYSFYQIASTLNLNNY